MGRRCRNCMLRIPYATLIATIMCCVGVGVFCGTMYRGATLCLRMFDEVFHIQLQWLEPIQLVFMVVGAGMGALGLMILFIGCLTTGSTRTKMYRSWKGRVGGRVSCGVLMAVTYTLELVWAVILVCLVTVTLVFSLFWVMCSSHRVKDLGQCIDLTQFDFLFPNNTRPEDMQVCGSGETKLFCKDYVENAENNFILACVGCLLVILSLIHYLMCLAANYAHITDQEKFLDLTEMQYLQENEMTTLPKDRF